MRSFVLPLLVSVLFGAFDLDLGLPPQPDLDLPILPDHYDPTNPPPAPAPPSPPDDTDDPRDEPPPVFYGEEIESENDTLCYVIDLSGSMKRAGRLERAKKELTKSILGLSPNVRFNIVAYTCAVKQWRPALVPATEPNKAAAVEWVAALAASGGTGTGPAVALALNDKSCLAIALLTDGAPNCGAVDPDGHRRMIDICNSQRASVSVFGVDASGTWREFCIAVARDGNGNYYDVP
jgi:hypothetical protein